MLTITALISGTGSNLAALLDACDDETLGARVIAVGADRPAPGLEFAERRGIPTFVVPFRDYDSREAWGQALLERIQEIGADVTVLSGLMRVLPASVVRALSPRLINTHPAYLPEFPGAHAVRDALAAGVCETGATVHLVDEGVDTGPVLAQERVPVKPMDDEADLHDRIKIVERRLLIDTVRRIAHHELELGDGVEQSETATHPRETHA